MMKKYFRLNEMTIPDLDQHRGKLLLINGVRISFLYALLFITLFYQLKQPTFFNTETIFPLYVQLITAFIMNTLYLMFFERTQKLWQPTAFLFAFDSIFITILTLVTGAQQSIFLFLYLVNIILCSFVFQRKGALIIAAFTSACFSLVLVLGPDIHGQTLFYVLGLNNIAFFTVAGLSGYLSEQLNFMGAELVIKKRDIKTLSDLNKIIVENISSGLLTVSSEYRVLLNNPAATKLLGISVVGKHIDEIFPGVSSILGQQKEKRFERRYQLPNGESILLGFTESPLETSSLARGYILIFQDLTEIFRLEKAMRRQEKLAAVGKLAAGIAHEIRNPLASISGSIELLKSMVTLNSPEEGKLMDIMLKEIARLNNLITEFLDFVKPDHRRFDVVRIDSLLNEVLDMVILNRNLSQDVKQVRNLKAGAVIAGDQNKLKQVFLNFFINAYQSMGDSLKKELVVETLMEGQVLVVKIRDTGHGMSEATQKRLFEPFFTTKSKGTGLGLATAHKILETHEAKIFVESIEGKGTEFTIRFNEIYKTGEISIHEGQNTGS